jgi:hypothetical protein
VTHPDPARATLYWVLADAEQRIKSATQGILRTLSGGIVWSDERVKRFRIDLERALTDQLLVTTALTELDRMDAEIAR